MKGGATLNVLIAFLIAQIFKIIKAILDAAVEA